MEWAERAWPGAEPRGKGFQIVFRRSVLNEIQRHGGATPEVEICGVLVGNVYRDSTGPFLLVEAMIRGDFAGSANAQVTFTAETWNHIQGVMEAQHPDQKIVGWYHTHPDFGIFLSEMDLFIHGNFFNLPWQIAYVLDPINHEDGVFEWRNGKAERSSFCTEEDAEKEIATVPVSTEMTAAALADFSRRMQQMEKRQKRMMVAVPFLLLVMIAWPFILFTALSERRPSSSAPVPAPVGATTQAAEVHEVVAATAPATVPAIAATQATTQSVAIAASQPATNPVATVLRALPTTVHVTAATAPTPNPSDKLFTPSVIRPTPGSGPKILENPPDNGPQ
jgi:proteasome lid subunit RPN8/RPN11